MSCIDDVLFSVLTDDLVRGDIIDLASDSHYIAPVSLCIVDVALGSYDFFFQSCNLSLVLVCHLNNDQSQSANFLLQVVHLLIVVHSVSKI